MSRRENHLGRRSLLCGGLAAALGAQPVVRKTVYAWYPSRFGTWDTKSIEWDAITHICFRSVTLLSDGTVTPAGYPPRAFLDAAHSSGVRVSVLAWSNNQQNTDSYLANHARDTVRSLLSYVRDNKLDGIAYDDEMIRQTNSVTAKPNRPLVNAFFQDLYQTFKAASPDYHIAYAAPPVISPRDRFGAGWLDWPAIAGSVDAIIPMLYTANPPSIGWTTSPEPLAGSQATAHTVSRDVVTLMGDYYNALGAQRHKLLLGINAFPWAGYEFRCRAADRLAPTVGAGKKQPPDYLDAQAKVHGKLWDSKQQAAWYVYQDGDEFVQGWFDDERSWAAKLDYVNQEGLGGVGMWVIDGAGDSPRMWDMLRTAFARAQK